jgi:hypothetical protein
VRAGGEAKTDQRREYDRERQRDLRANKGTGAHDWPFVGVDGEGGDDLTGKHQYYLLTAGADKIATGKPLTADECLSFISRLPTDKIYVAFFFDYDVTMILRTLPAERITRLMDRSLRTVRDIKTGHERTYAVDWGEYQIDYLPHKEFKVRRQNGKLNKWGKPAYTKWVVINDVGSFFQCSFVKAITLWEIGTASERLDIGKGKEKRADFKHLEQDTITYNALEIRLLEYLMEAYRVVCDQVGYRPRMWQGPGQLASAMMIRHKIPKTADLDLPIEVVDAANKAFYGGRFETTAVGEVPGPIYAYDINSAYPDALTRIPCLIHGTWEQVTPGDEHGRLYLAHGRYRETEQANLYNFEYRDKQGAIVFPKRGSGWYWSVAIDQAKHQIFEADTVFVLNVHCDCEPFSWIPTVYAERIRLGKTSKGIILKLAMNSLYGKTCQSVGAAPYANPIWGSLITAMTRAKLMTISHGSDPGFDDCRCNRVYMLATDAIFTSVKLDIPTNKDLGGWDLAVHDNLFLILAGLYFVGGDLPPKTRGVPRQKIVEREDELRKAYRLGVGMLEMGMPAIQVIEEMYVMIPMIQFTGIKLANARHKLETAGAWVPIGKDGKGRRTSFDWKSKRVLERVRVAELDPANSPGVKTILTEPHLGFGESHPYDKDIGRLKRKWDETQDQPDWSPNMKNEDM